MQPTDLAQLQVPSDPQIHPDATGVAYVLTQMDLEADGYRRRIHLHDGSAVKSFTSGPVDFLPRWSPDGNRLAFLRAIDLKKPVPQLAVMPADGGEAEVVTELPLGVEYHTWSPDGRYLCVVGKSWASELAELSDEERSRRARRITRFPYRFDNRGWLHDRRRQIWLIDPSGNEPPRRLTEGDFDENLPAWHPQSDRIAFVTDRHARGGLEPGSDAFEVDLEGRMRQVAERGGWMATAYSPKGDLHLLGYPETDYPRLFGLWREEPDGTLMCLTADLDRSAFSLAGGGANLPKWVGDDFYTVLEDSGRVEVIRIDHGGAPRRVMGGDRVVTSFDAVADRVVAAISTPTSPGELFDLVNGEEKQLTFHAAGLGFAPQPQAHWRALNEGVEIDAFLMLPEGKGPFPVLLNIHGGPASQYGFGFFDEFQVYAAAGYAVVACNPRGSSGRGLEFEKAVVGDGWGVVDLADITAVLDDALDRHPQLDRERLGIMGGSYGGFMTAWTIAHDDRFRSAVVERALISFPSFEGTSDIGPIFTPNYVQSSGLEAKWAKSPLAVADQIFTPTLLVHSEEDYRCPIEQAEQLLVRLLDRGIEAEMVRFPGEGHELSRSGKPRHRVERFEAILDWHGRYL
ncbi:MAG: S9 family peptidase [Acidimicrobiia bacterium]|nr:S9 family peptidase [Acidimicrobiia bacterium]